MSSLLAAVVVATTTSAERTAAVIDFRGPVSGGDLVCEQFRLEFFGTNFVHAGGFFVTGYEPSWARHILCAVFKHKCPVLYRRVGDHSLVVYGRLEPTGLKRPKVIRFESANPPPGGLPTVYNLPANDA